MNLGLYRRGIRLSEKGIFILIMILLLAGAVGKGIFENTLVGRESIHSESFLRDTGIALGLQAISTAAVPVFVHLLFETIKKAENKYKLLFDILILSILSETPYDLICFEKIFSFQGQNVFFGLFIAAAALVLLEKYKSSGVKGKAVSAVIVVAGFVWVMLLRSENGFLLFGLTAVYYFLREKKGYRPFVLAAVISAFSMLNPLYMPAPLGLVATQFCEITNVSQPKHILAFYPLMLISVYIMSLTI